jgi:hypothetical protein
MLGLRRATFELRHVFSAIPLTSAAPRRFNVLTQKGKDYV